VTRRKSFPIKSISILKVLVSFWGKFNSLNSEPFLKGFLDLKLLKTAISLKKKQK